MNSKEFYCWYNTNQLDKIINALQPIINNQATFFSKTKTPSVVLDREDYVQEAKLAILTALAQFKPDKDIDKSLAFFLSFIKLRIFSTLETMQRKNPYPVTVSAAVVRLAAEVFKDIKRKKNTSIEEIQIKFNVSKKIAAEAYCLTHSSFIHDVYNTNIISKDPRDKVAAKELLDKLDENIIDALLERKLVQSTTFKQRNKIQKQIKKFHKEWY